MLVLCILLSQNPKLHRHALTQNSSSNHFQMQISSWFSMKSFPKLVKKVLLYHLYGIL